METTSNNNFAKYTKDIVFPDPGKGVDSKIIQF